MKHKQIILVVGGAGYIGSHMLLKLKAAGYSAIALDNLSTGHRDAVIDTPLMVGNMRDANLLDKIFSENKICAVMHFASSIQVGESVLNPHKYYENNVANTIHLLGAMIKWKIKHFIFSSSAAVYGNPVTALIDEYHPCLPVNPYGRTKQIIESLLVDYASAHDLSYMSLRYFNAAGADPSGRVWERHSPETHLIPLVIEAILAGKEINIFGDDYPTKDGTCIRDYIHVDDLCLAHLIALEKLLQGSRSRIYNLGTGRGVSVKEVIACAEQVLKRKANVRIQARRAGDPDILVANPRLAIEELGWCPMRSELKLIIEDASKMIEPMLTT